MVDIMGLKEKYVRLKQEQLSDKILLNGLMTQLSSIKQTLTNQLKIKRNEMLRDKGARDDFGITNQKDWQIKINELTRKEEEANEEAILEYETAARDLEIKIDWRVIDITDAYWNLQIGLEQIKTEHDENLLPYLEKKG